MYTKEELESMAIPDLMGIAQELGIAVSQDDPIETVVYAILDKAAENSAATEAPKRKRTRIQKKDTSRVYTVNGKDGENFDVKNNRKPAEAPSLFSDMPEATAQEAAQNNAEEKPAEPKPKKRGRKSKAELAAEAAAKEAEQAARNRPPRMPTRPPQSLPAKRPTCPRRSLRPARTSYPKRATIPPSQDTKARTRRNSSSS